MGYVFRILNDTDVKNINNKLGLKGKSKKYNTSDEINKSVVSFVQNGSKKKKYPWISLSKNFLIANEKYNVPAYIGNTHKNSVAIIGDTNDAYDNTFIGPNKLVYDISEKDKIDSLIRCGKIKRSSDTKNSIFNPVLMKTLASNSREVLVYDNIPQKDIKYVLSPLEADLLYTYLSINRSSTDKDIDIFINTIRKINFREYVDSDIEEYLYKEEYDKNRYLYDICNSIYNNESKNETIDYLNLFKELNNINRNYYKKILNDNDIKIYDNKTIDDSLKIYASRKYGQKKDINLFNGSLIVPKSCYKGNKCLNSIYGSPYELINPYEEYVDKNSDKNVYLIEDNNVNEYTGYNKYNLEKDIKNCRERIKLTRTK